jgi:septal ring factor EnvC (AmiA/AmiB activator)
MKPRHLAVLAMLAAAAPAAAQDIRGLEKCTAETAMDRRTSCLQSNVEFLQQTLAKQMREMQARLVDANREITAQKIELAALKTALAKLQQELADLKKPKPEKK